MPIEKLITSQHAVKHYHRSINSVIYKVIKTDV